MGKQYRRQDIYVDREVSVLFLHKDDYKHGIMKNAVYLKLDVPAWNKAKELKSKYVTVQGVFDSKDGEVNKFYSGLIHRITEIAFYSDPARPRALYSGKEPYIEIQKE
jgi:hypothetical protein